MGCYQKIAQSFIFKVHFALRFANNCEEEIEEQTMNLKAGIHEQQKQATKQKQTTKTLFFKCGILENACFQLFLVFGKHVFAFGAYPITGSQPSGHDLLT